MTQAVNGYFLGRRPYPAVHRLMQELHEARRKNVINDVVLLLEHETVLTRGRGAHSENLLATKHQLAELGVTVEDTGRGGDITLHAPGQLIAYPIVNLAPDRQDVRKYVQGLTQVMSELVKPYGISPGTMNKMIGLWVDRDSIAQWPGEDSALSPSKIGAIGVRISRWVTSHGFALNLTTDLSLFQLIVPCGIAEHSVASVESLTKKKPDLKMTAQLAHQAINSVFGTKDANYFDFSTENLESLLDHARVTP